MRSKILSKLIFASCVWYSDRAYHGLSVLIKDIGRRLRLQLQCSYQGQQGDLRQSVRGNYKTRSWGGQNLTAVEGNASVYQVNTVRRISGEGRAEFLRTWGPDFDQKGGGRGGIYVADTDHQSVSSTRSSNLFSLFYASILGWYLSWVLSGCSRLRNSRSTRVLQSFGLRY